MATSKKKPKYPDVVLDIETLDVMPTAVVLSIGAVAFDVTGTDSIETICKDSKRCFHVGVTVQPQLVAGRTISAKTLQFWLSDQISLEAQHAAFSNEVTYSPHDAICAFSQFVMSHKAQHCWGNGIGFDNVIVQSLCNDFGLEFPFHYRGDKDVRTLKYLKGNIENIDTGKLVKHDALDDCISEALYIQRLWKAPNR